jgi:hypothetical protein
MSLLEPEKIPPFPVGVKREGRRSQKLAVSREKSMASRKKED